MGWRLRLPYLAGTMSGIKSYGLTWRKQLRQWLSQHRMQAYDPCTEDTKEHKKYDLARIPKHQWEKYPQPLAEEILKKDLNQIKDHTNFVICYFSQCSTGTVSELTFAYYHNIPVYIVTHRKLKGWPYTVSQVEGNKVFKTFDELKRFLKVKYHLRRK